MAADYIRNLREETKKGFYGRLKQGLYPRPAPIGYLNAGAGQRKILDPVRSPLVKRGFELYATGKYTQVTLADELHRLGLRNKKGQRFNKNFIGRMLRNPFYTGLIRIQKTGESYAGMHEPLISTQLFERVQQVLSGHFTVQRGHHDFLFRQLFRCGSCQRALVAERQKGRVYYRCHNRMCSKTAVREDLIEQRFLDALRSFQLDPTEHEYLKRRFEQLECQVAQNKQSVRKSLELHDAQLIDRLNRLTDAYLDGALERELFEQRKTALLMERRRIQEQLQQADLGALAVAVAPKLQRMFELTKDASLLYFHATPEEKRQLLLDISSNRTVNAKRLDISLSLPYSEIANCEKSTCGRPLRACVRTWRQMAENAWALLAMPQNIQI